MKKIKVSIYVLLIITAFIFGSAWMSFDVLSVIEKNYNEYTKKYPFVTVNVIFNQPSYAVGDTVFFAVRYQHEDKQYVKGTHLIKLDLVNYKGELVQSIRFKVTDGKGYNQLALNKEIEEGIYRLYVYSDWMRNFGDNALYQTEISILKRNRLVSRIPLNNFKFYPEGGKLIADVENKILVTGIPNTQLAIKDEVGEEKMVVHVDSLGMGLFSLTPQSLKKYSAHVKGVSSTWNLPAVQNDGVSVFFDSNSWSVKIMVSRNSLFNSNNLYTLILSEGRILKKEMIRVNFDNPYQLKLPEPTIPETIYQFYIIDEKGREIAQRIFISNDQGATKSSISIEGSSKQNDEVKLKLNLRDSYFQNPLTDASISVIQENLYPGRSYANTFYLYEMPDVSLWARHNSVTDARLINTYLITEKWERINWTNIFNNTPPRISYPFNSSIKLKGRVINKITNSAPPDSTLVIGFLQKNVMGYESFTKDGIFEMPLVFDFWGNDKIFITVRNRKKCIDENYDVLIMPDTVQSEYEWITSEINEYDPYADFAIKRNLISDSYKFYLNHNSNSNINKSPNDVLEEEFQGADHTINVVDYVVFPNMEDLLSEVVTFVQFKKKGNEPYVRLFYRYEKSVVFYKEDPIYVIDGVMTTNTDDFLKLKPEDLLTIKIINNPNKLAQLGSLGSNGIIFVESRKGNLARNLNRNLFPVTGLSEAKLSDFDRKIKNPSVPDLRSNLLWKPFIDMSSGETSEVYFNLSDDLGPMKIMFQGVTKNGKYFYEEKVFTVQPNTERK